MAGGITFGIAKDRLRLSVDGGITADDDRVRIQTDTVTELLLGEITPVNGMMEATVTIGAGNVLLLPPEMENAIYAAVQGDVNGQSDIKEYFYEITNPYTYIDPSMAKDLPLIDKGLVPDPLDPTVLRRKYIFPGVDQGTQVTVVGDKSFVPIVDDNSYLIIQNLSALEVALESVALRRANAQDWKQRFMDAVEILQKEVTGHMMDRRNFMTRRAAYEQDLISYQPYMKAWFRARIALDQPGAMLMGKSELDRLLDRAEMELIEMGTYKGTIEEFEATVYGGEVSFPARVESVLAVDLCGVPVDLRSTFFTYLENGPGGWDWSCGGYMRDLGEQLIGNDFRRTYRVLGSVETGQTMKAVCKLRWMPKGPNDIMTIRNYRAIRAMMAALIKEQEGDDDGAAKKRMRAKEILEDELKEYFQGLHLTVPISSDGWDMAAIGEML